MTTPSSSARAPFLVLDGVDHLPAWLRRAVVEIGNFDGLHRGHRAVIEEGRRLAKDLGRPLLVLTFEPHPRSYFRPNEPVFRLTPPPLKAAILQAWSVDGLITLPFTADLAAMPARDFVDQILFEALNVAGIVVGHDFHFGKGRDGSPAFVEATCLNVGRACRIVPPLTEDGAPVSSTAIRTALAEGNMPRANRLLGYRYLFQAEVRHGEKIGRTIGYPTANLRLPENSVLKQGIYAVRVAVGDRIHDGVASYGRRPTFDNGAPLFEVFLFDFSGDLYGQTLSVECVAWQRGEEKFNSIEALIAQMDRDSAEARRILARGAEDGAPSLLPL